MKQKQKKEKNSVVANNNKKIIALAIALVLLIGGTYAWLTFTLTGEKSTRIEAGNLSVEITGESNAISIPSAFPMSTTDGAAQANPYTFTLNNDGNIDSEYTVYLDDVALDTSKEFALSKSLVYCYLTKTVKQKVDGGEDTVVSTATPVQKTLDQFIVDNKVVLDTSSATGSSALAPDKYIVYTMRLWIKDTATNSDLQSTENNVTKSAAYAGKIKVDASQTGIGTDAAYSS